MNRMSKRQSMPPSTRVIATTPSAEFLVWRRSGCLPSLRYERVEVLESGPSHQVDIVRRKEGGREYVMKYTRTGATVAGAESVYALRNMKNQIAKSVFMNHPHIAKVFETYENGRSVCMIREKVDGCAILDRGGPYPEDKAARVLGQLLSAVRYMHDRQIFHEDLRPQNILFEDHTEETIKVVDCSLACFREDADARTKPTFVTLFMAPETLQGVYTEKADLWSVGVIAYAMLGGALPFSNPAKLLPLLRPSDQRTNPAPKFKEAAWKGVSEDAKNFVKSLLQINPDSRLDSHQAQRHRWIKEAYKTGRKQRDKVLWKRVIKHLKDYPSVPMLKRIALPLIAYKVGSSDLAELPEIFGHFDKSKSGVITIKEFSMALSKLNLAEEKLYKIFDSIDMNGDTALSYTDFLGATMECIREVKEDEILEAFERLDREGRGYVSGKEIETTLRECFGAKKAAAAGSVGSRVTYEAFREMFQPQKRTRRSRSTSQDRNLPSRTSRPYRTSSSRPYRRHSDSVHSKAEVPQGRSYARSQSDAPRHDGLSPPKKNQATEDRRGDLVKQHRQTSVLMQMADQKFRRITLEQHAEKRRLRSGAVSNNPGLLEKKNSTAPSGRPKDQKLELDKGKPSTSLIDLMAVEFRD